MRENNKNSSKTDPKTKAVIKTEKVHLQVKMLSSKKEIYKNFVRDALAEDKWCLSRL